VHALRALLHKPLFRYALRLNSNVRKKMKILFVSLFSVVLGVFLFWCIHNLIRNIRAKRWPTANGVVDHSATPDAMRRKYTIILDYRYTVEGTDFRSDRLRFGSQFQTYPKRIANLVRDRYCPGSKVSVYYNPENPSQAVLMPGILFGDLIAIMLLITFLFAMHYDLIFS
jgi:hypothetical protein